MSDLKLLLLFRDPLDSRHVRYLVTVDEKEYIYIRTTCLLEGGEEHSLQRWSNGNRVWPAKRGLLNQVIRAVDVYEKMESMKKVDAEIRDQIVKAREIELSNQG